MFTLVQPPPTAPVTPSFDAVGTGAINAATLSHNAAAGAYVILDILLQGGTATGATYGGAAMDLLGVSYANGTDTDGGAIARFGRAGVPTGSQTVSLSFSGFQALIIANTVSYAGVGSVGAVQTVHSTTPCTLTQACQPSQLAVVAFAILPGAPYGGLSLSGGGEARSSITHYYLNNFNPIATLLTGDHADSDTVFTASSSRGGDPYSAISCVLNAA